MEYDNFNDYMNDLNNAEKFQGYETLENFYFTHSALIKEFLGIDNQFKMWLDKNTYNAKAIAHLLPELPNLISNLSEIRFEITELDNYEDNIVLSKLIRYIKNVMTFSEVKNNFEKLKIESNNNLKMKQERKNNELKKIEKQNELRTKINLCSNLLLYFEGISKSYIDLCENTSATFELICNEINKFDNTINVLNTLKQDIDLIEKYNIISNDLKEQIFYIKKIMLLGELQEELNKFIRLKIENVTQFKNEILFEKVKSVPKIGLIERQIQDTTNSNDLITVIRFITYIDTSSQFFSQLNLLVNDLSYKQTKLVEFKVWWNNELLRLQNINNELWKKRDNAKFSDEMNFLETIFENSREYYRKECEKCNESIKKTKSYINLCNNVDSFQSSFINTICLPLTFESLHEIGLNANEKFNQLVKSLTI